MRRRQVSRTQTTSLARRFANSGPILPFNPASSIPGCQLWLDAADTSTVALDSSSSVFAWLDKSGNGRHTSTTGSVSYANSGISITASNSYLTGSFGSPDYTGSTVSCFVVASMSSSSGSVGRFLSLGKVGTQDGDNLGSITIGRAGGLVVRSYRNGPTQSPPSISRYDTRFLATWGQTSSLLFNSINGGTVTTQSLSGAFAINAYRIGNDLLSDDANEQLIGVINEIIVYFSELTISERQKIEGYLAHKWELTGSYAPTTPLKIPGCQLWLDVTDSSTIVSSGNLTSIKDKSTNTTTTLSSTLPTYSSSLINGLPGISFNGSSFIRGNFPSTYTGSNFIVFTVASMDSATHVNGRLISFSVPGLLDYSSTERAIPILRAGGDPAVSTIRSQNLGNTTSIGFNTNYLFCTEFTGSTYNFYLNGSKTSTASSSGSFNVSAWSIGYLADYGGTDDSAYWRGTFGECIIYFGSFTTTQRQTIETYLANKWGLQSSLPTNHPYKSAAPKYEDPIFLPSLIPGSRIWLDASDSTKITMSDSNVTQIVDKSSNGYVFTGSTGTYPTRTTALNGLSVISSSSGKYLQNTSFNQNFTTATFFAVLRPTQDITPNGISGGYPAFFPASGSQLGDFNFCVTYANQAQTGDPSKFFIEIDKQGTGLINGALGGASPSTYNPVNTPLNIGAVMSGSSGTNSAYLNGTSVNLTANNSGTFPLQSGRTVTVFAGFGCDYAETLIYGSVLTTIERQKIEGYLAHKWKLQSSLPANHPFKSTAPTTIPKTITIQSLSAFFNNGPTTCLTIPANSAVTLGTNNHTIEFWMYQVSHGQYDVPFAYGKMSPQTATTNYYMNCGSGAFGVVVGNGAGGWAVQIAGATRSLNTWHHYAVVRNGNTFTVYDNGTSVGSVTASINIPAQGDVFRVGSDGQDGVLNGYITNFRVVNGTAVYTSNFTPPTSPLTAIPNTQILIQGLVDRSPNAFTVTNNGGVVLSTTVSPFV
jgi:hypothetical protein